MCTLSTLANCSGDSPLVSGGDYFFAHETVTYLFVRYGDDAGVYVSENFDGNFTLIDLPVEFDDGFVRHSVRFAVMVFVLCVALCFLCVLALCLCCVYVYVCVCAFLVRSLCGSGGAL